MRHTGIVVNDMQRSLPFYRDLLGMSIWADFKDNSEYVQKVTGVKGANVWMIKLEPEFGGAGIELLQYLSDPQEVPARPRSCDVGCNHVALQVDDLDAVYEKLKASGIEFHTEPRVSSDGNAKTTYCRDPEGVIVELVQMLK